MATVASGKAVPIGLTSFNDRLVMAYTRNGITGKNAVIVYD
jgi:hypothetical protein